MNKVKLREDEADRFVLNGKAKETLKRVYVSERLFRMLQKLKKETGLPTKEILEAMVYYCLGRLEIK